MHRVELIQLAVDAVGGKDYLEIGVETGKTILNIKSKFRIGIDPDYKLDTEKYQSKELFLFKGTSDEYFKLHNKKIDGVVYVDGLHTYSQSLRDVNNSLGAMSERSIILIDDCLPRSYGEARPAESHEASKEGSWCGDVWKTIVHLRSKNDKVNVFTIEDGPGLAVVTRGTPMQSFSPINKNFENAGYEYYLTYKSQLMNIKSKDYYIGFLEGRKSLIES